MAAILKEEALCESGEIVKEGFGAEITFEGF